MFKLTNTTELPGGKRRKEKPLLNLIDSNCDHMSSCFTEQVLHVWMYLKRWKRKVYVVHPKSKWKKKIKRERLQLEG